MRWGVIFDMDGVLVDSGEAHRQAWRLLGEEVGHRFTDDHFAATFGMHNNQILPLWLGRGVDREEAARLAGRKEELFRALALHAIPGAVELVKALKVQGFGLAVGSSGPSENVEMVLRALGIRECFDALATGDDVVHGKPHPEVFLLAARALDLAPRACVVVEDAPQGIEAARRAGARVVALTSSRPAEALQGADLVVSSLADVSPARLKGLLLGSRS